MLWQALDFVEHQPLPPTASVAWVSDPAANSGGRTANSSSATPLNVEEGIHFDWHMQARNRIRCVVKLLDESGRAVDRPDVEPVGNCSPSFVLTAFDPPPSELGQGWQKVKTFEETYWAGTKKYQATVWVRTDSAVAQFK
jgi:hypothetical protein